MEKNGNDSRFMKVTSILILIVLVALTASLISMQFKLNQVLTQTPPDTQVQQSAVTQTPAAAPAPPAPSPAAPQPARQAASRSTVPSRYYTQPEAKSVVVKPSSLAEEPAALAAAAPQPSWVLPPAAPVIPQAPPEPRSKMEEVTVSSGTILTVRLIDTLNSDRNRTGDRFTAALDEPITSNGLVVAPRGSTVEGRVVETQQAGRVTGLAEMRIELNRLLLQDGRSVELVTDAMNKQGEPSRGTDAAKVGAGAAIGAAIGAIAGGRKGAGIGAATGAGAGTADVLLTRGKPVVLYPETRLSFQLRAPLHVEINPSTASVDALSTEPAGRNWGDERPRLRRRSGE